MAKLKSVVWLKARNAGDVRVHAWDESVEAPYDGSHYVVRMLCGVVMHCWPPTEKINPELHGKTRCPHCEAAILLDTPSTLGEL